MAKLVVSQLRSLQDELKNINRRLDEIADFILKNQNHLSEYELIKLTDKINRLEIEKKSVVTRLNSLEETSKSKREVGEWGAISFYNLVAFMVVPVINDRKYYVKIYEVVNARQFDKGGEHVNNYVVTLSGLNPSNSENYFLGNKKPLTSFLEVINYSSEIPYTSIDKYIEIYVTQVNEKKPIAFGGLDISSFGKSFDGSQLKKLLSEMERARQKLIKENQSNP